MNRIGRAKPGEKFMRVLFLLCAALASFTATMTLTASNANAVFWRGLYAPTNIDYHGFVIIKEPPPSPCQWIRVNGYYVRQCIY
jgi:hypothetical protein